MSLEKKIDQDYISAMKSKNSALSSTLSYLRAMLKQVKVDERLESLDDVRVVAIVKKQVKQRQESIAQFEQGNRSDLAAKEQAEIDMMKAYLPAELSSGDIEAIIDESIKECGATSAKDMGTVMKIARDKIAGRADGKLVSDMVKEKLSKL